jgi:hypothetical protein
MYEYAYRRPRRDRLRPPRRGEAPGESFSKAISRPLDETSAAHSGRDILRALDSTSVLSDADADAILAIVAEDRANETWDPA